MQQIDIRDFDSFYELLTYFTTEEKCEDYLATLRWNGTPTCPYCQSEKVVRLQGKIKRYKCKDSDCRKQFSVRVGTIFHDSKLPLKKWFCAIYLVASHKKGISSVQLSRDLKITQKAAWHLLHRVRECFAPEVGEILGNGMVEVDETYIGGKEKNKHKSERTEGAQGRSTKTKTPVLGILKRGAKGIAPKVFAVPVANTKSGTILPIIKDKVKPGTKLFTDEFRAYGPLGREYKHKIVQHSADEYVRGQVHTNSIESFWALFKRGLYGIYHHTSDKHLEKYTNEFTFRYNNKELSEGSKFDIVLANSNNKRLPYKKLIADNGLSAKPKEPETHVKKGRGRPPKLPF